MKNIFLAATNQLSFAPKCLRLAPLLSPQERSTTCTNLFFSHCNSYSTHHFKPSCILSPQHYCSCPVIATKIMPIFDTCYSCFISQVFWKAWLRSRCLKVTTNSSLLIPIDEDLKSYSSVYFILSNSMPCTLKQHWIRIDCLTGAEVEP